MSEIIFETSFYPSAMRAPATVLPGIDAAVAAVGQALDQGDKIALFCDYDPDGTSAAEVLRLAFTRYGEVGYGDDPASTVQIWFGFANAVRGFGLDLDFVEAAGAWGATLLITVDCGAASVREVAQAQALGMQVIVTDHHVASDDNPADHHLNPSLWGPSQHSGSLVAWKFSLALMEAREAVLNPATVTRGMYVACFGARSDWMDMDEEENAALWAYANRSENIPPGLLAAAEALGYASVDEAFPEVDGLLNLPKRTPLARAEDVAHILGATSAEEAEPYINALMQIHQRSESCLQAMEIQATANYRQEHHPLGWAIVEVEDCENFTGHAGNVAHAMSARHDGQPSIIFIAAGKDEWGHAWHRWAARKRDGDHQWSFADILSELQEVSTLPRPLEDGEMVRVPSVGGHPNAVSGRCSVSQTPEVIRVFASWANESNNSTRP